MSVSRTDKPLSPERREEIGIALQQSAKLCGICTGCCTTTAIVSTIALVIFIYCAATGNYFLPSTNNKLLGLGAGLIVIGTIVSGILSYSCFGVLRNFPETEQPKVQ